MSVFKKNKNNLNSAFSLIEVLIFISILSVFFVAAISVAVTSLRNMQINEHKIVATRYSQELLDWLRAEREEDWDTFHDRSIGTYCFNDSDISWGDEPVEPEDCEDIYSLGTGIKYKREAELSNIVDSTTQVKIKITTEWQELGNTYSVPINTVVAIWE